jgi:hypothetical protein
VSPALSAAIYAARELAWQPMHNLSNRERYAERTGAHERLVELMVDGLGFYIPGHEAPSRMVGYARTDSIGAQCAVVDPKALTKQPSIAGGQRPTIEAHLGRRVTPELRFLLEAMARVARCSFANRRGLPYYERKESVAQLRGCLLAYDRSREVAA